MKWQPIESAPKDGDFNPEYRLPYPQCVGHKELTGTFVDLWTVHGRVCNAIYLAEFKKLSSCHESRGPWIYEDNDANEYGWSFLREDEVTHWMPLPPPPK